MKRAELIKTAQMFIDCCYLVGKLPRGGANDDDVRKVIDDADVRNVGGDDVDDAWKVGGDDDDVWKVGGDDDDVWKVGGDDDDVWKVGGERIVLT